MTGLDQADTDAIALLRLSLADIEAGYVDAARGTNTGRLGGIRRTPRTKATVNQLLDRWLEVAEMETTTRNSVVGRLNRHVRPVLVLPRRQGKHAVPEPEGLRHHLRSE